MSRILRRPMFRGGPVDSYGNGIASGLGYARGGRIAADGRMKFDIAGLVSPSMASEYARGQGTLRSGQITGGGILSQAMNKIRNVPYLGRLIPAAGGTLAKYSPYALAAGVGTGIGEVTDWITKATDTPEAYAYRKQAVKDDPWAYHETDLEINEDGTMTSRGAMIDEKIKELDVGEKPGLFPPGGVDKWYADRNIDQGTGKVIEKEPKSTTLEEQIVNDKGEPEPEVKPELTAKEMIAENQELFKDLLGGKKAQIQDWSDAALNFFAQTQKEGATLGTALGQTAEKIAARPSRSEKINQTASALAINDYIAGKRSKEKIDQLKGIETFKLDEQVKKIIAQADDDWIDAVRKSAGKDEPFSSDKTLKKALAGKFEGKVSINPSKQKKDLKEISEDQEDFDIGFTIVTLKGGKKVIIQKTETDIKIRTDLPVF